MVDSVTRLYARVRFGSSIVSRGNHDREKRLTPPPHTQSPRKAHATTITPSPPVAAMTPALAQQKGLTEGHR